MSIDHEDPYVDLEACQRDGQVPPDAERFRIRINDNRYRIDDPKPTGRQLATLTPERPVDEQLIFMVLPGGGFEELRLEEVVDLRRRGVERFLTFDSSVSFRLVVDGERFEWGTSLISGLKLKEIARVDPGAYAVWREVRGGEDIPVANDKFVDLSDEGLERFFTVIEQTTAGEGPSILPSRDRAYLVEHELPFEETTNGPQRGVVIKQYGIPADRLSEARADVLILLPDGYSDVPPDMFYCSPWLRLVTRNAFPKCADQPFEFAGTRWQRWSRHSQGLAPGQGRHLDHAAPSRSGPRRGCLDVRDARVAAAPNAGCQAGRIRR